ncbi:MAG: Uma2 family endonuclease [Cyanobacteria bacterium J06581_3]
MTAILSTQKSKRLLTWQKATWEEYVQLRDHYEHSNASRVKLFFHDGLLLVDDMGWEGINHSVVRELFLLLIGFWIAQNPQAHISFMGGCLLEKDGIDAASPDLVFYARTDRPIWKEGESRKIDLDHWHAPALVGEISDTTLASDLDEKKRLYASLGISEYWVVDARGSQVFFFLLSEQGQYYEVEASSLLPGLSTILLEKTIAKVSPAVTNMDVALWFQQQISQVSKNG